MSTSTSEEEYLARVDELVVDLAIENGLNEEEIAKLLVRTPDGKFGTKIGRKLSHITGLFQRKRSI